LVDKKELEEMILRAAAARFPYGDTIRIVTSREIFKCAGPMTVDTSKISESDVDLETIKKLLVDAIKSEMVADG
jgi:hypothetical protein